MIQALRRKLASLQIVVIAVIILCTAGAALIVSEHQLDLREQVRFDAQLNQLTQDVSMGRLLQNTQLAKLEAANDLVISIWDNEGPTMFQGGWQPLTDRDALISRAMEAAPHSARQWGGSVTGDHGERYLAAVQRISEYRSTQAVVMLQDMQSEDAQRRAQRLMYASIALLALILLSAFSWVFTGHAVAPIQDAHQKQNQFVTAASHEYRTPLQIMESCLDALDMGPDDPSWFTGAMRHELNRMKRLSDDLTILTSTEQAKNTLFGPVELIRLAEEAVRDHQTAADEKQIELRLTDHQAQLPLIEGDPLMLRRAINILMDNAICYTPSGGQVEVSVAAEPKRLVLRVQDDGPGIAPEHQAHIFERFYRADQSRTDRAHSGLGLSIARQIIESHGGQLTYSPAKPHGSRFCMILPLIPK